MRPRTTAPVRHDYRQLENRQLLAALANGEVVQSDFTVGGESTFEFQIDSPGSVAVAVAETDLLGEAQPTIRVMDPSGDLIAPSVVFGDQRFREASAYVHFSATESGEYSIVIEDQDDDAPMSFSVRAISFANDYPLIENQDAQLTFNGDSYIVTVPRGEMSALPFDTAAAGTTYISVEPLDPIPDQSDARLRVFKAGDRQATVNLREAAQVIVDNDQPDGFDLLIINDSEQAKQYRVRRVTIGEGEFTGTARDQTVTNGAPVEVTIPDNLTAFLTYDVDAASEVWLSADRLEQFGRGRARVFDQAGSLVLESRGLGDFSERFELLDSGSYTIAVTNEVDSEDSTTYSVRVASLPGQPKLLDGQESRLVSGELISLEIAEQSFGFYPFDVRGPGSVDIFLDVTSSSFALPRIQIYDPTGELVTSQQEGSFLSFQFEVSATGRYHAVIDNEIDGGFRQPFSFDIRIDSPVVQPATDQVLENGELVTFTVSEAQPTYFGFDVEAAGTVVVSTGAVASNGQNPIALHVYDPAGKLVASRVSNVGTGIEFAATVGGQYVLSVSSPPDNFFAGDFEANLRVLNIADSPFTLEDPELLEPEQIYRQGSTQSGSFDSVRFYAWEGQEVRFSVGDLGAFRFQIFDSTGTRVGDHSGLGNYQGTFQPSRDDVYTAVINEAFFRDRFYSLDIEGASSLPFFIRNALRNGQPFGEHARLSRPDQLNQISLEFSDYGWVDEFALEFINESTGVPYYPLIESFSNGGQAGFATWQFDAIADQVPAGNYAVTLYADGAQGGAGQFLESDFTDQIYIALPGDTNLDGTVDVFTDGFAFLDSLGSSTEASWATGDFDGDGQIDVFNDGFTLLNNIGRSVVPAATALATDEAPVYQSQVASSPLVESLLSYQLEDSLTSATPVTLIREQSTVPPVATDESNVTQWARQQHMQSGQRIAKLKLTGNHLTGQVFESEYRDFDAAFESDTHSIESLDGVFEHDLSERYQAL